MGREFKAWPSSGNSAWILYSEMKGARGAREDRLTVEDTAGNEPSVEISDHKAGPRKLLRCVLYTLMACRCENP